jgi:nicotinic acid phosphoribosyltransferase
MNWTAKSVLDDLEKAASGREGSPRPSRQEKVSRLAAWLNLRPVEPPGLYPPGCQSAPDALSMNGLLTDLYELTMAAGYFEAGKAEERPLSNSPSGACRPSQFRPGGRTAAGGRLPAQSLLHRRRDRLSALAAAIPTRRPNSSTTSRGLRFTGDLFAVPEGTPLFAGEPMLILRAPIIEAQIPETYLLAALSFPT